MDFDTAFPHLMELLDKAATTSYFCIDYFLDESICCLVEKTMQKQWEWLMRLSQRSGVFLSPTTFKFLSYDLRNQKICTFKKMRSDNLYSSSQNHFKKSFLMLKSTSIIINFNDYSSVDQLVVAALLLDTWYRFQLYI